MFSLSQGACGGREGQNNTACLLEFLTWAWKFEWFSFYTLEKLSWPRLLSEKQKKGFEPRYLKLQGEWVFFFLCHTTFQGISLFEIYSSILSEEDTPPSKPQHQPFPLGSQGHGQTSLLECSRGLEKVERTSCWDMGTGTGTPHRGPSCE